MFIQNNVEIKRTSSHFSNFNIISHYGFNYHFEQVVCFCHYGQEIIGHFIFEYLPHLSLFSDDILNNSYFIVPNKKLFMVNYFELFNINSERILPLIKNRSLYARIAYSLFPNPYGQYHAKLIILLRDFIYRTYFKEYSSSLNICLLYNKPKNSKRHISNIDELLNNLIELFPNLNWTLSGELSNIKKSIKLFSRVYIFCSIHSSIFINSLFMSNQSKIVEIATSSISPNWYIVTRILNISHILFHAFDIPDFGIIDYYLNPRVLSDLILYSINIKNQI